MVSTISWLCASSAHSLHSLMEKAENVTLGEAETREMRTGLHSVSDIYCVTCGTNLGWKYHTAYNPSEKHKEGKEPYSAILRQVADLTAGRFVLEVECIAKEDIPALMQQDTSNLEARHRLMRSGAA